MREAAADYNVPVVELRHVAAPPPPPPPAAAQGLDQAHQVAMGADRAAAGRAGAGPGHGPAGGHRLARHGAAGRGHAPRDRWPSDEARRPAPGGAPSPPAPAERGREVGAGSSRTSTRGPCTSRRQQHNVDVNVDARQFLLHQQNVYNRFQTVLNQLHGHVRRRSAERRGPRGRAPGPHRARGGTQDAGGRAEAGGPGDGRASAPPAVRPPGSTGSSAAPRRAVVVVVVRRGQRGAGGGKGAAQGRPALPRKSTSARLEGLRGLAILALPPTWTGQPRPCAGPSWRTPAMTHELRRRRAGGGAGRGGRHRAATAAGGPPRPRRRPAAKPRTQAARAALLSADPSSSIDSHRRASVRSWRTSPPRAPPRQRARQGDA